MSVFIAAGGSFKRKALTKQIKSGEEETSLSHKTGGKEYTMYSVTRTNQGPALRTLRFCSGLLAINKKNNRNSIGKCQVL